MSAHRETQGGFSISETAGSLWQSSELWVCSPTDVVFLFAGDGVAADLSVLDGRQIPEVDKEPGWRRIQYLK